MRDLLMPFIYVYTYINIADLHWPVKHSRSRAYTLSHQAQRRQKCNVKLISRVGGGKHRSGSSWAVQQESSSPQRASSRYFLWVLLLGLDSQVVDVFVRRVLMHGWVFATFSRVRSPTYGVYIGHQFHRRSRTIRQPYLQNDPNIFYRIRVSDKNVQAHRSFYW